MELLTTVLSACAWVAYVMYTLCFIPQIITNYRVKSGSAISELFLFGYLNLHAIFLFYIFLLGLPTAYKVCVPVQLSLVLVMILQRLWYDNATAAKRMAIYYLANIALLLLLVPFALENPDWFGNFGGWATLALGYLSQAPQAFKIWRERSVAGFDKTFVYMFLLAGSAEMCGALIGGLPIQTKLAALRVLLFALIFLWQFKLYAVITNARPD
jgi:uncharacterized protein with PQ loop repeat